MPDIPRSRFWRRLLAWLCGLVLLFALTIYLTRDFWFATFRAYYIGRVCLAGQEYGRYLPDVDEIEILALGGEVPEGTPDSFHPDLGPRRGTINRLTIRGAEARSLADLWRNQHFNQYFGGLCHNPYYALRFRHQGKLVLETSICWACSNVILPVSPFGHTEYGFDAKSKEGQELLATLTRYAPHPAEPDEAKPSPAVQKP